MISLRPATPADRSFLFEVYASTRAEELAPVPWSADEKRAFLRSQFDAQDHAYRERYRDARFLVVEWEGEPAGRLYLATLPGELRVVDIALLAEHRGRGIGSELLDDVEAEADAADVVVSLHVERWNPARSLYERRGYEVVAENDLYLRMERRRQLNTAS